MQSGETTSHFGLSATTLQAGRKLQPSPFPCRDLGGGKHLEILGQQSCRQSTISSRPEWRKAPRDVGVTSLWIRHSGRDATATVGLLRGGATLFGGNQTNRVGYGGALQRDGNSLDAGSVPRIKLRVLNYGSDGTGLCLQKYDFPQEACL
jgi:hypothetical protein